MEDLSPAGASAPANDAPQSAEPARLDTTPVNDAPKDAVPVDTLDDELRQVFQKATKEPPPRDESGKFASKNPPAEQPAVDQPQEAKIEPQKPAAIDVPLSWSAEMKAKFATLPPEVQTYVAQRDKETHEHISKLGQAVRQFEPVGRLLEQNRGVFESRGVRVEQGLNELLRAQVALDRDPVSAIAHIANAYGVDLARYADPQGAPQNTALLQEVSSLKQQLAQLQSSVGSREAKEAQAAQKSLMDTVNKFAEGKADFEDLSDDIYAQITALKAASPNLTQQELLEKAYEAARWANPKSRERLVAEQAKAEQAKLVEEAKKKAEDAKKAAAVNVKGRPAQSSPETEVEDALRNVWRKHNAA